MKIAVLIFNNLGNSSLNYNLRNNMSRIKLFEIKKTITSLSGVFFKLLKERKDFDFIVINYVTLYLFFGFIFKLLGVKVVFIPHEGEPLFPEFLVSDIKGFRKVLTFKKLTQICINTADVTLFLSDLQRINFKSTNKYYNILHIGSNSDFFKNRLKWEERDGIFFPSRKQEKIKGYELLDLIKYKLINNDISYSQEEMAELYSKSKIVVIPSFIESYSFSMVEAMLSNCIIVTSKNVGLAYDLDNKYGREKLETIGIYLCDDITQISKFIIDKFYGNNALINEPNTRDFALKIGLGNKYTINKLKIILNEIKSFQ